ncbi:ABC transporter permease [Picrophilus oshimae]|uniref:Sugar ABC transporter 1, permease protein n=1 Tax=Picrophilus torridus (strain ATCC 700027 / DSM 9790 / JCM 10055 / NBRC 100828 / KAW 2/3) TaxID=1122961 RepID=Q6L086_PICTO|nr:ABC transporter permease subunit [Picrophilus oshimae]AAT43616.1 sugar ABC transporter 1, permease protein [Picrophilus oshimae DSM 9789]
MNPYLLIFLATGATTIRVLGLTLLSIVTGWFLAYGAIKSKYFENIYISVIEVFESVPVISFFPIVLVIFITRIGGPLGVELAADFLVFTAVVWNIWMAEYQAFKTVPREMEEVVDNIDLGFFGKLSKLYIPFSIPRIAANLFPSVSDGFFYITVSEVIEVGTHTYQTFGIGTLLTDFSNNIFLTEMSLLGMSFFVIATIALLREYTKRAVARYTLDTDAPIIRRGRLNTRQTSRIASVISKNPFSRLSSYYRYQNLDIEEKFEKLEKKKKYYRYVYIAIGLFILILLLYGSASLIISVKADQWFYLFSKTPEIIIYLAYDYARVATILLISLAIAIFLGYYLAVNKRAESVGIPIIQTLSAYPAPIYFPFVFIFTLPFISKFFGPYTDEFYVLAIGFISTFYYVFYSFWMGVKALPSEYWELMKNMNMGYFKKMRYIIIPAAFPYLISGISSTINSAWGGLMIGEYWPNIYGDKSLYVHTGLMKLIDVATANGNIELAAWASFIFSIVVVIYSILFTRKMMDLARKKYVAEEGIYAA